MGAVVEAYKFGIPEGPHFQPWTEAYSRDAVEVYAETLPLWYIREIASLFRHGAEAMEEHNIPVSKAQDWLIVIQHMHNASDAMARWVEAHRDPSTSRSTSPAEVVDRAPSILRYDRLAALTTAEGACRLARAADVVRRLGEASTAPLTSEQRRLLKAVASGVAVADLAAEFGYSRRSMFRELAKLWKELGVDDRIQAVRKAAAEGLLD